MSNRQSRGRQRIPIELRENYSDLYATFSKRRLGLFKKASELSTLGGVDIGVVIFSPTGIPYSFFSPTAEVVLERYTNPNVLPGEHATAIDALTGIRIDETNFDVLPGEHATAVDASAGITIDEMNRYKTPDVLSGEHTTTFDASSVIRIDELNKTLNEFHDQHEIEKKRKKNLDEKDEARQKLWWEDMDIEEMNKEQVDELLKTFEDVRAQTSKLIEQFTNGASSSAFNGCS